MSSVKQRIKEVKQPTGGYLNPRKLDIIELQDGVELYLEENVNAGLVGMAVDYLTRYINSGNLNDSFKISLMGAAIIGETRKANKLLNDINGLDDVSIINACKLCGYDVCYRAGTTYYKNVDEINPDEKTIFNIKTMVTRGINFFEKYGPIVQDGMTFAGGYTSIVSAGDADFATQDTLWDFKVSKSAPTKDHTLQLIIYYLLGMHSYECDFTNIDKIGIFNPRKNIIYQYEIKNIPSEIIKEIETDVIGYSSTRKTNIDSNSMTINDIMQYLKISRHMVMKYYSNYGLPLRKEKNKYVISKNDFFVWMEGMERLKEEQQRQQIIIMLVTLFGTILLLFLLFAMI